ncbi:MAG: DUF2059 domain-containing protein [Pseudomonadota bacterium]
MKKIVAVAALVFSTAFAPAYAQTVDPAAAQAVRELLEAMKYRDMLGNVWGAMSKQIPQLILQTATNGINADTKLTDVQKKEKLDKVAARIPLAVKGMQEIFADPKLLDEMINEIVPLYARHFSADELHQMAAFYKSPVGVKVLQTLPAIAAESMQLSQKIMMPRVSKMIETYAREPEAK